MLNTIKTLGTNIVRIAAIVIVGFIGLAEPMQTYLTSDRTLRNDFFEKENEIVAQDDWLLGGDEEPLVSDGSTPGSDNQNAVDDMMSEGDGASGENEQETVVVSTTATPAEEFSYYTSIDEVTITAYNGTRTEVEIPSVIDGGTVVGIDNSAFENNITIEKVIIPDTVTVIGGRVFSGCEQLAVVEISPNIEYIGAYAFNECRALTEFDFTCITSESLEVGASAFAYSGLQSVTIPSNWLHLNGTFYGCEDLTSVTFEKRENFSDGDMGKIEWDAFSNTGLQEITIPGYYTSIGSAFNGCEKLTRFTWEESDTVEQTLYPYTFEGSVALAELHLPASLASVSLWSDEGWGDVTVYAPKDSPAWQAAAEAGLAVQEE